MGIFDIAPYSPIMGRGIVPSNLDMMLQEMGFGRALTSGVGQGGATNAGSQEGPTNNDSMFGGTTDQQTTGFFGTDLFNDKGFKGVFNNNQPAAPTATMNQAFNNAQPTATPASVVPGLPTAPEAPAAPNAPSDLGMTSPTDMNSALNDHQMNARSDLSANLDSKSMGDVAPSTAGLGVTAAEAASVAANVSGENAGMAHTGVTPSGENGFGGVGGGVGQGDGGNGGMGGGPNGVGNPGDAGSGTAGAGQSGEGGQWRVGTSHTGDDGDDAMDEPVKGQVHENEAVLPRELRDLIGEATIAQMIRVSRSKLPDNQKKALIRALWS